MYLCCFRFLGVWRIVVVWVVGWVWLLGCWVVEWWVVLYLLRLVGWVVVCWWDLWLRVGEMFCGWKCLILIVVCRGWVIFLVVCWLGEVMLLLVGVWFWRRLLCWLDLVLLCELSLMFFVMMCFVKVFKVEVLEMVMRSLRRILRRSIFIFLCYCEECVCRFCGVELWVLMW